MNVGACASVYLESTLIGIYVIRNAHVPDRTHVLVSTWH